MDVALLAAGFAAGFFGSPHCLGMCGGIVMAFGLSMKDLPPSRQRLLIACYHIGRMSSYALLGVLISLAGESLLAAWKGTQWPRWLLGAVLIGLGLAMAGLDWLRPLERVGLSFWNSLSHVRRRLFPLNTVPKALAAGLLWGFLPCGLVYGALLLALSGGANGHPLAGAVIMAAFGLGTLPLLLLSQTAVNHLNRYIPTLRKVAALSMVLSGIWVIIGGSGVLHGHGHGQQHDRHSMPMTQPTMPMSHGGHH